ncbi:MAG: radical SAM protein [Gloeomargarita sp. SKYBB_i_bin120]|nr:B12-binding domain-containing radical SAM protein [Gloeomargarita sp. SKYG98]MCS7292070.1 B12-binding domain-containing radical SAM protein [Gloeomargarita sp. SKYB120]MDW8177630.1 radical SAM protein [Gloeomargarita sp. SKYBB_i_bin120]
MPKVWPEERWLVTPVVPEATAVPLVWAYPNTYSVGITSLGYQLIWGLLVQQPQVRVSRWFIDEREPLATLPELVGFSFAWELDYPHLFDILEQLDTPLWSRDRQAGDPLVFGGGPVLSANPEPFAEIFDVILLGDAEELIPRFLEAYLAVRSAPRQDQLGHLAQVPGVYVPQFYQPRYTTPTGFLETVCPHPDVPAQVQRQVYQGQRLAVSTVVTPRAAWENIYLVEVVRSCPEMCRFCLASYLTLPFRKADVGEGLLPAILQGLTVTNRIGLLGPSVTQHPEFPALLTALNQPEFDQVRISIASVRAATVDALLVETLARHHTQSLTIAVESGSERLRQVMNKKLDQAEIYRAAQVAQQGGLKGLKLYTMVGVPTETEADLEATVQLGRELRKLTPRLRLSFGCSTFVPKAQTPWQWCGVNPQAEKRLQLLAKQLGKLGVDFRPEPYKDSLVQALLSRGDRRLGPLLLLTREYGVSLGGIRRAFKALQDQLPPLDFYVHQDWPPDAPLPWQHLTGTVTLAMLHQHWQRSLGRYDERNGGAADGTGTAVATTH